MLLEGDGWRSKQARDLDVNAKLLLVWLLNGPHPDRSGLARASQAAISAETGIDEISVAGAKAQLRRASLIAEDGEWLLALEPLTTGSDASRRRAARAALRRLPADSPLRTTIIQIVPQPGRQRGQRRQRPVESEQRPGQQQIHETVDPKVVPIASGHDNPFRLRSSR